MSQIRDILTHFLKECDITYPRDVRLDQSFRAACYADAQRRGFDLNVLGKSLEIGIAMGGTGYRHLKNDATQIFMALWTGLFVYLDDAYETHAQGLDEFLNHFMMREPQRDVVLDYVVALIHEIPNHWGIIAANLITTSGVDYITSTIIDRKIEGMKVSRSRAFLKNSFHLLLSSDPDFDSPRLSPVDPPNEWYLTGLLHHDLSARTRLENMDPGSS